jgi:hypothetical protein
MSPYYWWATSAICHMNARLVSKRHNSEPNNGAHHTWKQVPRIALTLTKYAFIVFNCTNTLLQVFYDLMREIKRRKVAANGTSAQVDSEKKKKSNKKKKCTIL